MSVRDSLSLYVVAQDVNKTKIHVSSYCFVLLYFKGRFLEFRMYHNFAYLFSKL